MGFGYGVLYIRHIRKTSRTRKMLLMCGRKDRDRRQRLAVAAARYVNADTTRKRAAADGLGVFKYLCGNGVHALQGNPALPDHQKTPSSTVTRERERDRLHMRVYFRLAHGAATSRVPSIHNGARWLTCGHGVHMRLIIHIALVNYARKFRAPITQAVRHSAFG